MEDEDVVTPRLFELSGSVLGGRYEVLEKLGEGGMATVYAGRRKGLSRRVAIKVLKRHLAADPHNVRRFLREARAASLIGHENIVDILDFGEPERLPVYFVMEFLEGQDLKALLAAQGALPWDRVRDIALQITAALEAAHGHGIVHRDIKPGNIFVVAVAGSERVKVLDFGIAKIVEEGRGLTKGLTQTKGLIGTVTYMAPEQARSGELDQRTDVYQLGVVLYQMLVGEVPFAGGNPFSVLERHVNERPQPLRARVPGIPEELECIVLTCLAKRPSERFQSMAALRGALRNFDPDAKAPLPILSVLDRRATDPGDDDDDDHTTGMLDTLPPFDTQGGIPFAGTQTQQAPAAAVLPKPPATQIVVRKRGSKRTAFVAAIFAVGLGAGIGIAGYRTLERPPPASAPAAVRPSPPPPPPIVIPIQWPSPPAPPTEALGPTAPPPSAPTVVERPHRPRRPPEPRPVAAPSKPMPASHPPTVYGVHPDLKTAFDDN